MFKRSVTLTVLLLIMQIAGKQDTTARTRPPGSKIPVDSIIAAIERVEIRSCLVAAECLADLKECSMKKHRQFYRRGGFGFGEDQGNIRGSTEALKKRRDAFYFSVQTFVIGVVSDWYPTEDFLVRSKNKRFFGFRTLSMIEGALGWILLVLFVVTLIRKFIR